MASEGQDKYNLLTPEQQQGTRGWKQGNMYRYVYPPYREEDMIKTPIPLEGVQASENVYDAYRGLKLQSPVRHRMGIFDISVSTDGDVEVVENEFSFNKRERPEKEATFSVNVPPKPQNQAVGKPQKPLGKDWYLQSIEAPESLRSFGL